MSLKMFNGCIIKQVATELSSIGGVYMDIMLEDALSDKGVFLT